MRIGGKSRYLCSLSVGGGGGEIGATPRAHVHQAARDEVKQIRSFQWKKFTDLARQLSLYVRPLPSVAARVQIPRSLARSMGLFFHS